jgi:5-formyltetrahydrofolate cyclo-ligase
VSKAAIRETVWDTLEESGTARFPFPPHDRIPNFAGAGAAANRLAATDVWARADAIKANPDAPQLPVRRRALHDGKAVYMAVPRLRDEACFVELDPDRIDDLDSAATVSAMDEHGRRVKPAAVHDIDLIVSGSVAVSESGARVGKGEGYSDLEYALLRELDLVRPATPVVTTVHELQVREQTWSVDAYDVPMDMVVTPERRLDTETALARPAGIDWDALDADRIEEMPVLAARAPESAE